MNWIAQNFVSGLQNYCIIYLRTWHDCKVLQFLWKLWTWGWKKQSPLFYMHTVTLSPKARIINSDVWIFFSQHYNDLLQLISENMCGGMHVLLICLKKFHHSKDSHSICTVTLHLVFFIVTLLSFALLSLLRSIRKNSIQIDDDNVERSFKTRLSFLAALAAWNIKQKWPPFLTFLGRLKSP